MYIHLSVCSIPPYLSKTNLRLCKTKLKKFEWETRAFQKEPYSEHFFRGLSAKEASLWKRSLLLQRIIFLQNKALSAQEASLCTLQHTATNYNTLQHTAAHCSILSHTATHRSTLQYTVTHCTPRNAHNHRTATPITAAHCSTLQHTATHCNTLQRTATHCNTLQHTATHYNTLHTSQHPQPSMRHEQWASPPACRATVDWWPPPTQYIQIQSKYM